MGFWSRDAVWRRIELAQKGLPDPVIFAVCKHLRVSEAALPEQASAALYVYAHKLSARALLERATSCSPAPCPPPCLALMPDRTGAVRSRKPGSREARRPEENRRGRVRIRKKSLLPLRAAARARWPDPRRRTFPSSRLPVLPDCSDPTFKPGVAR